MKLWKRLAVCALCFSLILSFAACSEEEKETAQTTGETSQEDKKEAQKKADDEAIRAFLADYRSGVYRDKMLFQYDDFSRFLTLGEYKGITYPDDAALAQEVSQEKLDNYLVFLLLQNYIPDDEYETVSDGTVQLYDVVVVDYRGVINGVEDPKATAKDQKVAIGSGSYIDGFEEGILGARVGVEFRLDLAFSPYYESAEVAGKNVSFFIKVKSIQRPTIPELTAELFNEVFGTEFKTMDEIRADVKKSLDDNQAEQARAGLKRYLQRQILKNSTVLEYGETELAYYKEQLTGLFQQEADSMEMTIEDYCQKQLGVSYEEFSKNVVLASQDAFKEDVMIRLIAQAEGIVCQDEQIEAMIRGLYENSPQAMYFGSLKAFIAYYVEMYGADYFENEVMRAAVMERVLELAVKAG